MSSTSYSISPGKISPPFAAGPSGSIAVTRSAPLAALGDNVSPIPVWGGILVIESGTLIELDESNLIRRCRDAYDSRRGNGQLFSVTRSPRLLEPLCQPCTFLALPQPLIRTANGGLRVEYYARSPRFVVANIQTKKAKKRILGKRTSAEPQVCRRNNKQLFLDETRVCIFGFLSSSGGPALEGEPAAPPSQSNKHKRNKHN